MKSIQLTAWLALRTLCILSLGNAEGVAQVTLSVNRADGSVVMLGEATGLDSYMIGSENALLSPDSWNSLADQGIEGWVEENATASVLSELNPSGSIDLTGSLNLGNAYTGTTAAPRDEDLSFRYANADGHVVDGLVEYVGPINDLVLSVEPMTGAGSIGLMSANVGPFGVTAYSIHSDSGSLSVEGFTGLGGDWIMANGQPTAIAELNLTGSQRFTTGTSLSIGTILTEGGQLDFRFMFFTATGDLLHGTVDYPPSCCPDCNGDGVIDISDANCIPNRELDRFLRILDPPSLRGDADGDGAVQFPDLVILSENFGQPGQYTDGDFDKDSVVQFGDLVILSTKFGMSGGSVAAAAPEPSSLVTLGLASLLLVIERRRR